MEPVLEVQELKKVFRARRGRGGVAAVNGVSFRLYGGEILGIVGESGCGKSTLVRTACRLLEPTAGSIRLDGRDITHAKGQVLRSAYREMQMVFQFPAASFDPRRTIGDGVGESLRNQKMPAPARAQQVEKLLAQCGLEGEIARRYPHEVSGGQCQRAAIARALAAQPRILICDEATSALDVMVQQQIMALLAQLRESGGLSILFICHNLALVQSFCDRVLVIEAGRVVEEGTPDEVIRDPRTACARRLVDAAL